MKFPFICPRCRKRTEVESATLTISKVNCGDCLMNDVEIVEMIPDPEWSRISAGRKEGA